MAKRAAPATPSAPDVTGLYRSTNDTLTREVFYHESGPEHRRVRELRYRLAGTESEGETLAEPYLNRLLTFGCWQKLPTATP